MGLMAMVRYFKSAPLIPLLAAQLVVVPCMMCPCQPASILQFTSMGVSLDTGQPPLPDGPCNACAKECTRESSPQKHLKHRAAVPVTLVVAAFVFPIDPLCRVRGPRSSRVILPPPGIDELQVFLE